ncbi:hypothetical protein ZIOFF_061681 [Zingiber officinale]|uniref:Uncharacterized protein n=1 Tax=Zingiber officinale TaxID=94328 RepID=A0A8J5F2U2_ZINOF|nr:hypothetical protein ZIOFF_061681 [Zingiber officinale]
MEKDVRESEIDNINKDVDEFEESDYDFDENDRLFETFVDYDARVSKEKDMTGDEHISDELLHMMQQHEGDVDCVNDDGFGNPLTSDDDDEIQDFPIYDKNTDSENPQLKLGLIFNSKKEAKFAIESYCIRKGMSVMFVKRPNRIEIQIRGSSNTLSNVNVDQSTIIQTSLFVKGGRNYTTISRLQSISSDSRRQVQSMSQPMSKPRSGPNISKKRITSSQSSVIKNDHCFLYDILVLEFIFWNDGYMF